MLAFSVKTRLLCASCTSLVLAMPASAQDLASEPLAERVESERASIEVLKEGMLQRQGDPEWTFISMRPSEVFFPGDRAPFSASGLRDYWRRPAFEKVADYPRDVQTVERWYLNQIPDLYEEVPRDDDQTVKVLYLPGCDEPEKSDIARVLPGEAAESNDFTEEQWFRARVETAMAQAGIERSEIEANIDSSPEGLRRLNRHLLASVAEEINDEDETETPAAPLVLKRYCGAASEAAKFPGVFEAEPPPPPPPPPPAPAPYVATRYFFIDLPQGMATAKVGRGIDARRCRQRNLPLQSCLAITADESSAIKFIAEGRHVFIGKLNGTWTGGNFEVGEDWTKPGPLPPPPPGQSYVDMGYAIHLVLDLPSN